MELDSFLVALEAVECDPPGLHRDCERCNRPRSVCVCYALPEKRLDSKARLIVLQHPYEIRRRLATVPLLSAALEKVDVPRGRRFEGERCPPSLRGAMEEAERKKIPVLLMFPGPGALDVKDVAERGIPRSAVEGVIDESGGGKESNDEETTAEAGAEAPPLAFGPVRGGEYILVVVDGTWHQGKQMFRDLAPWFLAPRGPAIRVQLPIGDAAEELSEEAAAAVARAEEERRRAAAAAAAEGGSDCGDDALATAGTSASDPPRPPPLADVTRNICADTRTIALFKEPFEGCMTTAEAIARALAELEPSPAPAAAVLSALNAVVDSQKKHDPAVRARCGEEGAEEPHGEANLRQDNGGNKESWHKRLHERRERKRAAKAARDAALGIVASEDARKHEEKKRLNQSKSKKSTSNSGLADGRNKFGFKNPPSNSCAECLPKVLSEEARAARKAEKLAARIENRRRKQEAAAALAAAASEAAATEG